MNDTQWIDWAGQAPLDALRRDLAAHPKRARMTTKEGDTALLLAAQAGDSSRVEILLRFSDANTLNRWGWSALMQAASQGDGACVRLLLPHTQPNTVSADGYNALMLAIELEHLDCVQALAGACDLHQRVSVHRFGCAGRTPLMLAACASSSAFVEALVPHCTREHVALRDPKGHTALNFALQNAQDVYQKAALLLPLSDMVTPVAEFDRTPLMLVAAQLQYGHNTHDLLDLVLSYCSKDVCRLQDAHGRDALMLAVSREHLVAVKALAPLSDLSNRAQHWKNTALMMAVSSGVPDPIAHCIIRHCTCEQLLLRNAHGESAFTIARLKGRSPSLLDAFASVMDESQARAMVEEFDHALIPQTLAVFECMELARALAGEHEALTPSSQEKSSMPLLHEWSGAPTSDSAAADPAAALGVEPAQHPRRTPSTVLRL